MWTATAGQANFSTSRGLDDPDAPNRCLLRRIINREGRSRAFINGAPANSNDLAELAATLIDIHGQNEHQSLLRRDVQLDLLDHYAGVEALAARVRDSYRTWRSAADKLNTLQTNAEQSRDRRTLLEYQLGELTELAVSAGEYEDLHDRYRRMSKSQDIQTRIGAALDALEGESESGVADVARVVTLLGGIDDAARGARERSRTARHGADASRRNVARVAPLPRRTDAVRRTNSNASRRGSIASPNSRANIALRPELLAARQTELTTELSALSVSDAGSRRGPTEDARRRSTPSVRRPRICRTNAGAARRSSRAKSARTSTASASPAAASNSYSPTLNTKAGSRSVEYHIMTNPKYPAAPLARIASGGERSRVSLAIQVVAAEKSKLPALILDEADVGIGGTTADVVGRLLRRLAARTQVLCVTHAPQVAARGEHHLLISKSNEYDTVVEPLDSAGRVAELARMLGGQDITKKTIEYAEELISAGAL